MTKEPLQEWAELYEEQKRLLLEYRVALNNANKSSQIVLEKLSELLDSAKENGETINRD